MFIPKTVCGSILISPRNRILLVRGKTTGKWSFPKGHIQPGETKFECAARETFEETGLLLTPYFNQIHILSSGIYFQYYTTEKECNIQDSNEVEETAWIPYEDLSKYPVNLDVNAYLRKTKSNLNLNKPTYNHVVAQA